MYIKINGDFVSRKNQQKPSFILGNNKQNQRWQVVTGGPCCHGQSNLPPPLTYPPIAGLLKENRWFISPDHKAGYLMGGGGTLWWGLVDQSCDADGCWGRESIKLPFASLDYWHLSWKLIPADVEEGCRMEPMIGSLNGIRTYFFLGDFFFKKDGHADRVIVGVFFFWTWAERFGGKWWCKRSTAGLPGIWIFMFIWCVWWMNREKQPMIGKSSHHGKNPFNLWMGYYCWWFRNPARPEM